MEVFGLTSKESVACYDVWSLVLSACFFFRLWLNWRKKFSFCNRRCFFLFRRKVVRWTMHEIVKKRTRRTRRMLFCGSWSWRRVGMDDNRWHPDCPDDFQLNDISFWECPLDANSLSQCKTPPQIDCKRFLFFSPSKKSLRHTKSGFFENARLYGFVACVGRSTKRQVSFSLARSSHGLICTRGTHVGGFGRRDRHRHRSATTQRQQQQQQQKHNNNNENSQY